MQRNFDEKLYENADETSWLRYRLNIPSKKFQELFAFNYWQNFKLSPKKCLKNATKKLEKSSEISHQTF